MSPAVSVVGRSNSGKTTLIEKLIVELKKRGYTVAAFKHSGSDSQLDHPGKDTWCLSKARSDAVVPHFSNCHTVAGADVLVERLAVPSCAGRIRLMGEIFVRMTNMRAGEPGNVHIC